MADPEGDNPGRNARGQFSKGNPGGPGGARRRSEMRQAIERGAPPEYVEGVVRRMVRKALESDTKAADLVLKYTVGRPAAALPETEPAQLPLPDLNSSIACGKAAEVVVSAVNQGAIDCETAKVMLNGIKARSVLLPPAPSTPMVSEGALMKRTIPYKVVRVLFQHFARTGELPEDPDQAAEIIERVKAGCYLPAEGATAALLGDGFLHRARSNAEAMDTLLDEAVYAPAEVQDFARAALIRLARCGTDVTGNPFPGLRMRSYGTAGMEFMGYPDLLARRPYIAQAERLFTRLDAIRERMPEDRMRHEEWMQQFRDASVCFRHAGERPSDILVFDAILATHELATLMGHARGENVRDLMQLFDTAARRTGEEREQAIAQILALAKAGRFTDDSKGSASRVRRRSTPTRRRGAGPRRRGACRPEPSASDRCGP